MAGHSSSAASKVEPAWIGIRRIDGAENRDDVVRGPPPYVDEVRSRTVDADAAAKACRRKRHHSWTETLSQISGEVANSDRNLARCFSNPLTGRGRHSTLIDAFQPLCDRHVRSQFAVRSSRFAANCERQRSVLRTSTSSGCRSSRWYCAGAAPLRRRSRCRELHDGSFDLW